MDHLFDALNSFRCCLDEDIEVFLHQKAVDFLKRELCAVYLIVDEQAFDAGRVKIEAYFTLSHKTLIPTDISKTRIKDVSGFKDSESLHFVLIGQLGKHIEETEDGKHIFADISSREMLDNAFEVIRASSALVPCRCVLVECSENEKVHRAYENYGFKYFQFDGEHYQYYKRL